MAHVGKGRLILEILEEAGISSGDPEWSLQYNLCHGALDYDRLGLDDRIRIVMENHAIHQRRHDTELEWWTV